MLEDALQELFDFLLVADTVLVCQVFAFFVLVEAFALALAADGRGTAVEFDLLLCSLQLDVSLEWHV